MVSAMMTEDNEFELVPTLHFVLWQWQQEADGADAPQEELAFNLDKIALVVPDRTVAQALKRAAKAARGDNTSLVRALAAAAQSVERHLPEDYFPELWKLVSPGNYSIEDTMIGFNKEETTMLAKMLGKKTTPW
jgi:hypothetical protein